MNIEEAIKIVKNKKDIGLIMDIRSIAKCKEFKNDKNFTYLAYYCDKFSSNEFDEIWDNV